MSGIELWDKKEISSLVSLETNNVFSQSKITFTCFLIVMNSLQLGTRKMWKYEIIRHSVRNVTATENVSLKKSYLTLKLFCSCCRVEVRGVYVELYKSNYFMLTLFFKFSYPATLLCGWQERNLQKMRARFSHELRCFKFLLSSSYFLACQ